ncbi:MAG: TonB-dependent receptor [Gammaproteobacteria bacterium]|nr:TonB-dependent receptor [Gammaproteobacteria bacterium]
MKSPQSKYLPKLLKSILMAGTCSAAMLAQSSVFAQTDQADQQADADDMVLEEVVVTGIRRSLDYAAGVKRESNQVVDALMAQDIGLFADNNIGEALARIPGVVLEREAGEGYRITIRGLGPRFVRTTVNGRTALSSSGGEGAGGDDARGFTYNIMPSEVVSKVRVLKSTQAMDIEGGIGGTVDLQTNRPLEFKDRSDEKFFISGVIRGTYNDLSEDWNPRASLFTNYKFSENWGAYFGAVWDDADRIDNLTESQRLRIRDYDLREGTNLNGQALTEDLDNQDYSAFSGVRYQEQPIERERQTYIAGLQFRNDNWDINLDWTHGDEEEVRDDKRYWMNTYDLYRSEQSITDLWVDFDDAIPDQAEPSVGTLWALDWDGYIRNNMGANLYRQLPRESSVDVGGINVKWNKGAWTVSGDIGYANQSTERILERLRGRLDTKADRFDDGTSGYFDISSGYPIVELYDSFGEFVDPLDTTAMNLDLVERRITSEEGEDVSARLDFMVDLEPGNNGDLVSIIDSIGFGVAWNEMTFTRDAIYKRADKGAFDISTVADVVINDLMPSIKVPGFVHDFAIWDINDPQFDVFFDDPLGYSLEQSETFDLTEETTAGYVQFNFSHDGRYPYRGNFGVRYVTTDQTNLGWVGQGEGDDFIPADPENPVVETYRSYNDWLPSFNFAMDLSDTWVMRAAANKAFTRPDPIDMSGRLDLNDLDDEGENTGRGGNTDLIPYITYSYDLSLEWYPEIGGSYGAGLFYKDLQGYISSGSSEEIVNVGGTEELYDIKRPVNTDGGTITGVELQFHTPFDFSESWIQYFGMNGSYTYVDAEMDAVVPDRNVPISLRGTSEHAANLVFYFEKKRFGARISAHYRSAYLYQEASDTDRYDEFTNGSTVYDLNLDYIMGKSRNMRFRFSANNLGDVTRSRYWNTPGKYFSDERFNGRTFVLEFRIDNG